MHNLSSRQRKVVITFFVITSAYALFMSASHIGIAQAASGISARYDGMYSGMAVPA